MAYTWIRNATCNSCNMGTSALPDMYAQSLRAIGPRLRAYILGKTQVPMLQLICYTSSTLKSAQNLTSIFSSVYIVMDSDYNCGSWF